MTEKLKNKLYELWYGHPLLLSEEVDIIVKTRSDPRFSYYNEYEIKKLIQIKIDEMYEQYKKQQKCPHKEWDSDTQIRTIECRECGKRAWIKDYRNLHTKF